MPPLDLAGSLEPFRRSGDDLIDRWDGHRLLRTIDLDGRTIAVRAVPAADREVPALEVTLEPAALPPARPAPPAPEPPAPEPPAPEPSAPQPSAPQPTLPAGPPASDLAALVARAVEGWFVVAPPAFSALLAGDPVVAALDRAHPGLRPVLQVDLFTALVRSISAQQVNLAWAATTRRRLAEALGERHDIAGEPVFRLDAGRIAAASVAEIRAMQFTTRKAESIIAVAEAIASGLVQQAHLAALPDDEVIEKLVALRGIGVWSAEWILARTFGRPRVVAGDLGVRKAVARAYLGVPIASAEEVRAATGHWGPAAAIAQTLLLRSLVAPSEYARTAQSI